MTTELTRAANAIGGVRLNAEQNSTTDGLRPTGLKAQLGRVRAWMLVLPVDAAMLVLPLMWNTSQWKATLAMTVLAVALMTGGGRYRARLHLGVLDELPLILTRVLTAAALVALVIAQRHEQAAVTTFLTNTVASLGLLVVGRIFSTQIITLARKSRITRHIVVLIGGGSLAMELAQILRDNPRYGLSVAGFVDDSQESIPGALTPRLGRLADLSEVVRRTGADVLLVADGTTSERELHDYVRTPECMRCDLLVVPRMRYFHTQTVSPDHIGSIPIMRINVPSLRGPARTVKRAFDVVVAGATILLLLPVLIACAVAVRFEGGPGFLFRQQRVGRDGVIFDCLKFRSMRPVNETESATQWSVANDQRVGPVGRFLRRTSLDELPQLWNIIRGDMTLVGPRPERPHFVSRFSEEFERYAHRHRVQSGLTGLAQVSGLRGDTSIADRARYDNYYIENWTLWLDIKIILRTFGEVFFARGR